MLLSSFAFISTTSGEPWAREGRYAFMATKEAPKPTFAKIASRAERGHKADEEGNARNKVAAVEPRSAKKRRRTFLKGAGKAFRKKSQAVGTSCLRWSARPPIEMTVKACSATDTE
jgi:hypothetical protein